MRLELWMTCGARRKYHQYQKLCASPDTELVLLSPVSHLYDRPQTGGEYVTPDDIAAALRTVRDGAD
jgi:hypothetical protein